MYANMSLQKQFYIHAESTNHSYRTLKSTVMSDRQVSFDLPDPLSNLRGAPECHGTLVENHNYSWTINYIPFLLVVLAGQ